MPTPPLWDLAPAPHSPGRLHLPEPEGHLQRRVAGAGRRAGLLGPRPVGLGRNSSPRQPRAIRATTNSIRPVGVHAWHTLSAAQVAEILHTGPSGLSAEQVDERRREHGWNELEEQPATSHLVVLLHQFKSPLIYMLLIAAGITGALEEYVDAAVITAVLLLNAAIGFTQERHAEAAVRTLTQLLSPRARVIRDGREWDVESRDLVPGDLVLLESGMRVPADLRLVSVTNLRIDESLLTGESLAVTKQVAPLDAGLALADRRNLAFTGTIVTAGRGRGFVIATGMQTELGSVAEQVRREAPLATPLQHRMARFARVVAIAITVASSAVFGIGIASGEAISDMFLAAVALAVAAIPEGLPVAFTIALALGVRRMARRHAIVRRLPAVETLGSTTVICSDKTGTLTENRMTVQAVWSAGQVWQVPPADATASMTEALRLTLVAGVLATEAALYRVDETFEIQGDPTEGALLVAAATFGLEPELVREANPVRMRIPFESERRYSAAVCDDGESTTIYAVGAPERIIEMCEHQLTQQGTCPMNPQVAHSAARALAAEGLRVLGLAYRPRGSSLTSPEQVPELHGLTFLGLQGMMDPPRPGVADAIDGCRAAGIRVIMITGDHAITARAIGRTLKITTPDGPVVTGAELERLDEEELIGVVEHVSVFARAAPEHKLRIVRALQAKGHVVAVTGDGVNDAPALRQADIGIAMGRSGTDVAREAADMVLADDNFVSIYAAVEEGRITFTNVRKVTFFLLSTGLATIVIVLSAVTARWPLPLLPAQLLWLNLVTNGLQDVALAFEPGEPDTLHERPRRREEGIVSPLLWARTLITGSVMAIGAIALYRWELDRTGSLVQARTVALTTLVLFMAFHVGNARSDTRSLFQTSPMGNPFLLAATAGAVMIHALSLSWEPTKYVLHVEPVDAAAWLRMTVVASSVIVAVELHKFLIRRRRRHSATASK